MIGLTANVTVMQALSSYTSDTSGERLLTFNAVRFLSATSFRRCLRDRYLTVRLTSPQSNLRSVRRKGPIGYNGTPQIHSKTAPSLRRSPPKSNTLIPPQTASGYNRSFCHYTFRTDRQTDRQTDGLGDRSVRYADRQRRAKNDHFNDRRQLADELTIIKTYTRLG